MGPALAVPAVTALLLGGHAPRLDPALEAVPLEALAAAPERWLGEEVETVLQLAGPTGDEWTGFLTGFDPRTHAALDCWSDAQELWDAEAYARPVARVFQADGDPDLATLPRHTRVRAVVRVDAFAAGRGWLRVARARVTHEQVPEGTVLHAIRALALLDEGAHELAASELERALRAPLPAHQARPLEAALARARAGLVGAGTRAASAPVRGD